MISLLILMTGLMAGIYFAFSVFIMKSLSQLASLDAARAMNKINDVIVNTLFLPLFFVSVLCYAGLIVWSLADWQNQRSVLMIAAALLYLIGMFLVTIFGNVPLNNKLKSSASDDLTLVHCWESYRYTWTRLNHVRTLCSMAACVLLTLSQ